MSESEYPSWRDAIRDNDKIANLRCGLKYVLWHLSHAAIAILALIWIMGAALIGKLTRSSAGNRARQTLFTRRAKRILRYIVSSLMIMTLLLLAGLIIYLAVVEPLAIVVLVVELIAIVGIVVIGVAVYDRLLPYLRERFSGTGEKAAKTPVVRRIYGQCPVSMDMEPKWFERLFE